MIDSLNGASRALLACMHSQRSKQTPGADNNSKDVTHNPSLSSSLDTSLASMLCGIVLLHDLALDISKVS